MRRLAVLFSLLLAACATPPDGVGQFASASARLAADTTLAARFRDTYEREQPYLSKQLEPAAKAADRKRRAAYDDLAGVHRLLAAYMTALARMAGTQPRDFGAAAGALTEAGASLPGSGLTLKHADAYGRVAASLARALAAHYRQGLLKNMVKDNEADVQTLLAGLRDLVELYRKTHENERRTVLGMLDTELAYAGAARDRLLLILGRSHLADKSAEYRAAARKYTQYTRALEAIALGHRTLAEQIDRLDQPALQAMLAVRAAEIDAGQDAMLALDDDKDPS
jgi:hypothetical protein